MKAKNLILCVSFIPRMGIDPIQIPIEVRHILKKRIENQYATIHSPHQIYFDLDEGCPEKGFYHFSGDEIILDAASQKWQGAQSYSLNDILDGKKLYFPTLNPTKDFKTQTSTSQNSESNSYKKWLWILGGSLLASGVGWMAYSSSQGKSIPNNSPAPHSDSERSSPSSSGKGRKF